MAEQQQSGPHARRHRLSSAETILLDEDTTFPLSSGVYKLDCFICYETYVETDNDLTIFLKPAQCSHSICFKCVIKLYATNRPFKKNANIQRCPTCNRLIKSWRLYTGYFTIECFFVRRSNPTTKFFHNHWNLLKQRHVNVFDYAPIGEAVYNYFGIKHNELEFELKLLKYSYDASKKSCNFILGEHMKLKNENKLLHKRINDLTNELKMLKQQK
ncbi:PE38 [Lonomia obliqua multiple nucleopolyhedrovirus]|uniref:PE38 n=1 Tax=Lonomia obliqua multiple nucleopolyhedrovirus TaxID=134394 RepID=A0A126FCF5_9ABAC|nr:PE38 [Lonomia obliqua multiple nucleopolyhedrovirus]AKN81025.1 PE38 [Lonomia obliqua multiple nucleopolyhedrovirus]